MLENKIVRELVVFLSLTGILSFFWFVSVKLLLEKRDVPPILILNAVALAFLVAWALLHKSRGGFIL